MNSVFEDEYLWDSQSHRGHRGGIEVGRPKVLWLQRAKAKLDRLVAEKLEAVTSVRCFFRRSLSRKIGVDAYLYFRFDAIRTCQETGETQVEAEGTAKAKSPRVRRSPKGEPDQAAFFSASPLEAITSINSFHDFTNDFAPSSWRRAAKAFTSTPA
jgi:hypothetical protein